MGWSMSHSSTLMMNQTATLAPSGRVSFGRSKMGESSARGLGMRRPPVGWLAVEVPVRELERAEVLQELVGVGAGVRNECGVNLPQQFKRNLALAVRFLAIRRDAFQSV